MKAKAGTKTKTDTDTETKRKKRKKRNYIIQLHSVIESCKVTMDSVKIGQTDIFAERCVYIYGNIVRLQTMDCDL